MVVGSSSHGGERKRQFGLAITVLVSGWSPPAGRPWGGALTIKGVFYCESPTHGSHPLSGLPLTSSVGSESAPHFNKVPVVVGSSSHGGERKRQ